MKPLNSFPEITASGSQNTDHMHIDEPSQPHQIENSANDFSSSASLSNTFYDMGDTSVSSKLSALVKMCLHRNRFFKPKCFLNHLLVNTDRIDALQKLGSCRRRATFFVFCSSDFRFKDFSENNLLHSKLLLRYLAINLHFQKESIRTNR